jgi:hypothetical protein
VLFHKRKERKLEAEQHARDHAQLRDKLAAITDANGVISVDGFRDFCDFADRREMDRDIAKDVRIGLAQGGVFLVPCETSLILKKNETALLDTPVSLLKEVADRELRGASQGVSIPIGGGMRYRVGAVRGHMVTVGTHWAVADEGALTVTDHRIVYHGGRKTLEFPYPKLATINVYSDAIDLGVTTRQSTSSFSTPDADLIAGMIHGAISHQDGITIVKVRFED